MCSLVIENLQTFSKRFLYSAYFKSLPAGLLTGLSFTPLSSLGCLATPTSTTSACPGTASTRSAAMEISSRAQSVVDFLAKGPVLWSIG
uniref:Uncharacterized protein n=1 Tax=Meloidogyne incognita TaxID=6306 RepID=A0A914MQ69_MELIC